MLTTLKIMIPLIAFLAFSFYALDARADSFDVNLTSWHSDKKVDYNINNFGLGYTKTFDHHWSGKVGFYDNSYNKTSTYALISLNHRMSTWSFGIDAGFVTGYDNVNAITTTETCTTKHHYEQCSTIETSNGVKNLDKYQFVIYPTATYFFTEKHALTAGIIPAYDGNSTTVVGLQYRFIFGE